MPRTFERYDSWVPSLIAVSFTVWYIAEAQASAVAAAVLPQRVRPQLFTRQFKAQTEVLSHDCERCFWVLV